MYTSLSVTGRTRAQGERDERTRGLHLRRRSFALPSGNAGTSYVCLCLTAWFQIQAYTEIPDFQICKLHRRRKHLIGGQMLDTKVDRKTASWAYSDAAAVGGV